MTVSNNPLAGTSAGNRLKNDEVLRLLMHRFGRLPQDVEVWVRAASLEELDGIVDRILDANSLEDVVGVSRSLI